MRHEFCRFGRRTLSWTRAGWTFCAIAALGPAISSAEDDVALPVTPPEGAIVLFDGKGTNLFVSATGGAIDWPVVDGTLVSTPNGRRSNNVVSRLHFRDADIHVEFQLPPVADANSGVFLHGEYELQILAATGKTDLGAGDMGAVYGIQKPLVNAARPAGQWQTYDIHFRAPRRGTDGAIAEAGSATVWLNGRKVQDNAKLGARTSDYNPYVYDTSDYLAIIAKRERATAVGPLMLQDHDCPVRFRNIWVKPLDDRATMYEPDDASQPSPRPVR